MDMNYETNIQKQISLFTKIIKKNKKLMHILNILEEYAKDNPAFQNHYVGAGCVNQTVFNYLSGYEIDYGIKDVDIVYYDSDTSYEAEDKIIKDLEKRLGDCGISYDIKNEARVHIWYNEKYEDKREPYTNLEDAVSSWGATVTCIGVRLEKRKLLIYCPFGLSDIFSMTIRPVKRYFTKDQYEARAQRWKKKWNKLTIISWN